MNYDSPGVATYDNISQTRFFVKWQKRHLTESGLRERLFTLTAAEKDHDKLLSGLHLSRSGPSVMKCCWIVLRHLLFSLWSLFIFEMHFFKYFIEPIGKLFWFMSTLQWPGETRRWTTAPLQTHWHCTSLYLDKLHYFLFHSIMQLHICGQAAHLLLAFTAVQASELLVNMWSLCS